MRRSDRRLVRGRGPEHAFPAVSAEYGRVQDEHDLPPQRLLQVHAVSARYDTIRYDTIERRFMYVLYFCTVRVMKSILECMYTCKIEMIFRLLCMYNITWPSMYVCVIYLLHIVRCVYYVCMHVCVLYFLHNECMYACRHRVQCK